MPDKHKSLLQKVEEANERPVPYEGLNDDEPSVRESDNPQQMSDEIVLSEWERQKLKSLLFWHLQELHSPDLSPDFAKVNELWGKLTGTDKAVIVRNG